VAPDGGVIKVALSSGQLTPTVTWLRRPSIQVDAHRCQGSCPCPNALTF